MRIWSIHPKYLDSKGLVALWRETLLAKNVLEGKTKGYINHPQLIRFSAAKKPLDCINFYLATVWKEAKKRNYNFNEDKFEAISEIEKMSVTNVQMAYEKTHLLNKLQQRDEKKYAEVRDLKNFEPHPLFMVVEGELEPWEKI